MLVVGTHVTSRLRGKRFSTSIILLILIQFHSIFTVTSHIKQGKNLNDYTANFDLNFVSYHHCVSTLNEIGLSVDTEYCE